MNYENLLSELVPKMREHGIIIYGGGIRGRILFEILTKKGFFVNAIVDKCVGKDCAGMKTISLSEIKPGNKSVCIISPRLYEEEMVEVRQNLSKYFVDIIEFNFIEWMIYGRPTYDERMNYSEAHPFNHYESPFSNRMEYETAVKWQNISPQHIDLNIEIQKKFIKIIGQFTKDYFDKYDENSFRWMSNNCWFGDGDGTAYHSMIRYFNPKRIIEIGSGFSTAIALDTLEFWNVRSKITCIEPYPKRLYSVIKESDKKKINIIEDFVQNVSISEFQKLEKNDILFIDSSHVLKSGGDVFMEYLQIMPQLKSGVIIHIHDIFYPFQYPPECTSGGRPYTEAFLLHALLMDNPYYEILFWGNYVGNHHIKEYKSHLKTISDFGCSFWMRKK